MLKNKIALVTGASSGIGRATALAFAREGAKVVVSDVQTEQGEETAAMVRARSGGRSWVLETPPTIMAMRGWGRGSRRWRNFARSRWKPSAFILFGAPIMGSTLGPLTPS